MRRYWGSIRSSISPKVVSGPQNSPPNFMDFFVHEFWRFVYVQQEVGKPAATAIDYRPMQDPASFKLDAVKAKIEAAVKRIR
jgi:hypothetical protein